MDVSLSPGAFGRATPNPTSNNICGGSYPIHPDFATHPTTCLIFLKERPRVYLFSSASLILHLLSSGSGGPSGVLAWSFRKTDDTHGGRRHRRREKRRDRFRASHRQSRLLRGFSVKATPPSRCETKSSTHIQKIKINKKPAQFPRSLLSSPSLSAFST